jgi:acyl dehydratase
MSIERFNLSNIDAFVGRELGVSQWTTLDQRRIDEFADCTGDRQWIHVDVERRAAKVRSARRSRTAISRWR